jgi:beta-phosphoglucomutase
VGLIVVLDCDGVIIDTVPGLYRCFEKFLSHHGQQATQEMFDYYNGMKLEDILIDVKGRFSILQSIPELLLTYKSLMIEVYTNSQLMHGLKDFLTFCKNHQIPVCIATSTHRSNLTLLLKRYGLKDYFQFSVAGDEVRCAKPSPEMLLKIQEKIGAGHYIVVDDSENGLQSAINAKMEPIHFAKESKVSNRLSVSTFAELTALVTERLLVQQPKHQIKEINIEILPLKSTHFPASNQHWNSLLEKNPSLLNGSLYVLSSFLKDSENKLQIKIAVSDYKNWTFQKFLSSKNEKAPLISLAVTGIVVNPKGMVLAGRRGPTMHSYPNHWELVPSGSMEPGNGKPEDQLIREFTEETGLTKEHITSIKSLAIIFDRKISVLDIAYIIQLKECSPALKSSKEYSEFSFMEISQTQKVFRNEDSVATSKVLLNYLEKMN